MFTVPESIIDRFGSINIPIFYELPQVKRENSELSDTLNKLTQNFEEYIESDSEIQQLMNKLSIFSVEQQKLYALCYFIQQAVAEKRLKILMEDYETTHKRPYNHPDLREVPCDLNGLAELNAFDTSDGCLKRGNSVFNTLLSIAKASNSMYWVNKLLMRLSEKYSVRVRLDPLLIQPFENFRLIEYKMWVYGKELDWSEIKNLKESLHMRWQPDSGYQEEVLFTDLVWSPRDDGIHFICEEVPTVEASKFRGSRYYHSIYSPSLDSISHCDGAIRIYSRDEIMERHTSHVRKMGKIGKRIKIFKIDAEIPSLTWTSLIKAFFVWNQDVGEYFA